MINTKQKEVWKVYPEYPFIEASNLGRIRTKDRIVIGKDGRKYHIKGQVLKQQLSNSGYMYVHFSVNGKQVSRFVHRIVIACFRKNPDRLPEVNHINNNPTDNRLENLEYCTREYNITYREKHGVSAAEAVGRPVFAVDLKTGRVLRFETQSEAARQLGVNLGNIYKVLKGQCNETGGYWFTENENEITEEKIREIKAKMKSHPIIAINSETLEILRFDSQREAERELNVFQVSICKVIKGEQKVTKGFWFVNIDDNAVEKTRAKFGDEVAEKVEKLIGGNYD